MPANRNKTPDEEPPVYRRFGSGRTHQTMSFRELPASLLSDACDLVTSAGDLLSFARTSDGGAVVVSVVSGGQATKRYAASLDELASALNDITDDLAGD